MRIMHSFINGKMQGNFLILAKNFTLILITNRLAFITSFASPASVCSHPKPASYALPPGS